jgi:hypothetical protein
VFDDDDAVAGVHKSFELAQQLFDVGRVEPRGRLVEDIQRVAALGPLQLGGELDPLRFTARQLVAGWPRRMYPTPTSRRTSSERRTGGASAKKSAAASTVIASTSAIVLSL